MIRPTINTRQGREDRARIKAARRKSWAALASAVRYQIAHGVSQRSIARDYGVPRRWLREDGIGISREEVERVAVSSGKRP